MVEDTLKPGFDLPRHHHKKMTEVFYILEGELTLIFDDETVVATAGTTVNVPPNVWHEAKSENGANMLTLFSPAGFEDYLAEMKTLTDEQFADETFTPYNLSLTDNKGTIALENVQINLENKYDSKYKKDK